MNEFQRRTIHRYHNQARFRVSSIFGGKTFITEYIFVLVWKISLTSRVRDDQFPCWKGIDQEDTVYVWEMCTRKVP